jgi:hypothetical protein
VTHRDRLFFGQMAVIIMSSVFLAGDWVVDREGGWLTGMFWSLLGVSWILGWLQRRES